MIGPIARGMTKVNGTVPYTTAERYLQNLMFTPRMALAAAVMQSLESEAKRTRPPRRYTSPSPRLSGLRSQARVTEMYHRYGTIADSDQSVFSLYFGRTGTNHWRQVPISMEHEGYLYDWRPRVAGDYLYIMNKND